MILTECPHCDRPIMTGIGPGRFAPHACPDCDGRMVIEMTRLAGKTYAEEYFVDEILPGLDIERIDHPSGEAYVYGNPEKVGIRTDVGGDDE